jgi:hypothetical protein
MGQGFAYRRCVAGEGFAGPVGTGWGMLFMAVRLNVHDAGFGFGSVVCLTAGGACGGCALLSGSAPIVSAVVMVVVTVGDLALAHTECFVELSTRSRSRETVVVSSSTCC